MPDATLIMCKRAYSIYFQNLPNNEKFLDERFDSVLGTHFEKAVLDHYCDNNSHLFSICGVSSTVVTP